MHAGIVDIAEWLGFEVVDVAGEYVLRERGASRKWREREQRATDAEVHLYAAIRALMMGQGAGEDVGLRVVAKALGVDTSEGVSIKILLDSIADTLARERKYREAYGKASALVNDLRETVLAEEAKVRSLTASLMNVSRVGPKGGDRGELARQVRLGVKRMAQNGKPIGTDEGNGIMDMADFVLRLLGEEPPTREEWLEMTQ